MELQYSRGRIVEWKEKKGRNAERLELMNLELRYITPDYIPIVRLALLGSIHWNSNKLYFLENLRDQSFPPANLGRVDEEMITPDTG
ncbi:hypothetical protein TNCV_1258281 [Trichonephila clavipes]|nr:hypothetical protein TNCV_1258281 [Trichonephila clavipes]